MQKQTNPLDATMISVTERILSSNSNRSKRTLLREIAMRTINRDARILRAIMAVLKYEIQIQSDENLR